MFAAIKWCRMNISLEDRESLDYVIGSLHEEPEEFADPTPGAAQRITARELSKAQAKLARLSRLSMLGVLGASVTHEIRQPLAGIIINASTCMRMLAADPPNIAGAIETARLTLRDGKRASDVISRLQAMFSNRAITVERLDLNEIAKAAVALSFCELQKCGVVVQTALGSDLPGVNGDRVQLQQVVLNLLLNAVEAMRSVTDRPRHLMIRTIADAKHVSLAVRDVGIGIASTAARLFEPFYTTKGGGMGIGLSVSRAIIESHHGKLCATPNEGPGATFSFAIPRCIGRDDFISSHSRPIRPSETWPATAGDCASRHFGASDTGMNSSV